MTGTDVTLMSKTKGTQDAYRQKCPKCKAKPGEFCKRLPRPLGPYQQPDPSWGKPTRRPHNERFEAVWRTERRMAYEAAMNERAFDPMAAERRALADLARQEHDQMRTWLRRYAWVLTHPES